MMYACAEWFLWVELQFPEASAGILTDDWVKREAEMQSVTVETACVSPLNTVQDVAISGELDPATCD